MRAEHIDAIESIEADYENLRGEHQDQVVYGSGKYDPAPSIVAGPFVWRATSIPRPEPISSQSAHRIGHACSVKSQKAKCD